MEENILIIESKRNLNIDLYRGIAIINIIAIHTAFWSGGSYTPHWFQSLTLLLDVPYFFYISGRSICFYEGDLFKTTKVLLKTWLKWVFSITILAFVFRVIGSEGGVANLKDLFQNYFFNVSFQSVAVLAGSTWFMPFYFVIIPINQIILAVMSQTKHKYERYKKWYCSMLLAAFVWVITNHDLFGINQYYLFYSFFLMLGVLNSTLSKKIVKRPIQAIFCTCILYVVFCYLLDLPYIILQQSKFPPNLPYLFASMLLIIITVSIDKYIKNPNKCLIHIGQNTIFYFIGQGIGSSLIYFILPRISINIWFLKWLAVFIINLIITIIISELLYLSYTVFIKAKKYIKPFVL